MISRFIVSAAAVPFLLMAVPANAGRTAIDENPDGSRITASFAGYCDFNGDDCGDGNGLFLPYRVSIGGADFTNRVVVQGNGVLTFGAPVDFFEDSAVREQIESGGTPELTAYARTLVSAGQSNILDDDVFMQSALLDFNPANGAILATWFTCIRPTAQGVCPPSNRFTLTLTPRRGGFAGHFDFRTGSPENSDRGYVSGGVFTATGNDFFLPTVFEGIAPGVPEPASWALMITGFGATGVALRRRSKRVPVAA